MSPARLSRCWAALRTMKGMPTGQGFSLSSTMPRSLPGPMAVIAARLGAQRRPQCAQAGADRNSANCLVLAGSGAWRERNIVRTLRPAFTMACSIRAMSRVVSWSNAERHGSPRAVARGPSGFPLWCPHNRRADVTVTVPRCLTESQCPASQKPWRQEASESPRAPDLIQRLRLPRIPSQRSHYRYDHRPERGDASAGKRGDIEPAVVVVSPAEESGGEKQDRKPGGNSLVGQLGQRPSEGSVSG